MKTLLCGLNWIGDSIMAFPALAAFRRLHPEDHLAALVKPGLAPLWRLHPAGFEVLTYEDTNLGTMQAAGRMRAAQFDRCFVLPNSFRSAWIPFVARIPERVGRAAGGRDRLLTRIVPVEPDVTQHQQLEYFELLAPREAATARLPGLTLPAEARAEAETLLEGLPAPLIGLLPGAARGPSKRWPAAHFAEVGRRFAARGAGVALFGAPGERALCAEVAAAIGSAARDLSGRTALPVWAAALAHCGVVVCNDSGGMHLAAAVGTPLVAVFGQTDPRRTGPLGARCTVLQESAVRDRAISREDAAAQNALAAIPAARVYDAALAHLA